MGSIFTHEHDVESETYYFSILSTAPPSFFQGILLAILEVCAVSTFVFLALSNLPPHVSLFLLNGVCIAQIAIDVVRTPWRSANRYGGGYTPTDKEGYSLTSKFEWLKKTLKPVLGKLLENKITKTAAFVLQIAALVGLAVCLEVNGDVDQAPTQLFLQPIIAIPISIVTLAIIWNDKFQIWIAQSTNKDDNCENAQYMSSK